MHVNFWFRHDENFILFIKIPQCRWDVPMIHGLYLVMLLCERSYMQPNVFKQFCFPLLPNTPVIILLIHNMLSFQLDGCMFVQEFQGMFLISYKKTEVITNSSIMFTHHEMERHSERFAEEPAISK